MEFRAMLAVLIVLSVVVVIFQQLAIQRNNLLRIVTREQNNVKRRIPAKSESTSTVSLGTRRESTGQVGRYIRPPVRYLLRPVFHISANRGHHECLKNKGVRWRMTIFIKSTVGNFQRREFIRRTWASLCYVDDVRFDTVFVCGKSVGSGNVLLKEESMRYGDILQFDGPDDYRNIAQKTLAAMQWASNNLHRDDVYSSGDDDFLINVGRLQEVVDEAKQLTSANEWPEMPIICSYKLLDHASPIRNPTGPDGKWYIAASEYKWPVYPRACFGGFYTVSVGIVRSIFEASRTVPTLRVDDVWITGILRTKIGMPDAMVLEVKDAVGTHMVGYREQVSKTRREFMWRDWKTILKAIGDKTMCIC